MKIEVIYEYDYYELIERVRKKEILLLIPSFFALTMASEVLRSLSPGFYSAELGEEFETRIKANFESGQFLDTSCFVFPYYPTTREMESWLKKELGPLEYRALRNSSFKEILNAEIHSLKTRDIFLMLDDVNLNIHRFSYVNALKDLLGSDEYFGKIDRVRVSYGSKSHF